MSFGSAMARGRRLPAGSRCPCGSGVVFDSCCAPILDGAGAETPEALMRSRFTAFALGDLAHLKRSWHPSTRPEPLTLNDGWVWLGLRIVSAQEDGDRGAVEFRARWRDASDGATGELHEASRFRRVGGRWLYVDGDIR